MSDKNVSGSIRGYELREQLGQGGFGEVYRAFQPIVEREVAIKVILPKYANDPEFIRSFDAEAQTVARLEHPFIIPIFDYWREPDSAYLVMRYLRGGSLRSRLKQGPIPIEQAIAYVETISSALSFAHRNGVIHRDLKPDNILLDEEGNAYLSDFGIARRIGRDPTTDNVSGSLAYMSPDQLKNVPPTPQSDIYSLGIMLYELFTGQYPYKEAETWQLINIHLSEPLPDIHALLPDLPDEITDILEKATAKEPEERYEDARLVVADLQRAFKHEVISIQDERGSEAEIINPYKGLRAFQEADAVDFFGRNALVNQLLSRMQEQGQFNRFLAVIGPSGSGKSSVVRAGLVPRIRNGALPGSENWFVADIVPGPQPLRQLEAALLSVALKPPARLYEMLKADMGGLTWAVDRVLAGMDGNLVLIIDQFEEVFTLVEDEAERTHFLDLIKTAITSEDSRLHVIITLRADFTDRPLEYASFGELMQSRTEFVLPLLPDEIEQAISGPAMRVGLQVDRDLIAVVTNDVSEEPGALPLLQYALTEVFARREGRRLTLAAYQDSGGVLGALARRAEEVFVSLDEQQQRVARQILLRMVTLGEGTEDTRRRANRTELAEVAQDVNLLQSVLDAFGKPRLLSFDVDSETREPMIEVAHEALIREWTRLRGWLDNSRADVRLQRVLAGEAAEWEKAHKDASFLLSGARLAQYEEWQQTADLALTQSERNYLQASIEERSRRDVAEAERKRREEEIAQRATTFETRALQFRRAAAILGIVILLAVVAAIGLTIQVVNTQEEVAVGQTQIAGVAPTLDEANTQIAGVEPTLEAANAQIAGANTQIANADVQVAAAQEQIATAEAQIAQANVEVAAGQTQVAGFEPTVNAANEQIAAANAQIAEAERRVAGVEPTLNAANAQIAFSNTQVAEGQTQVAGFAPTIDAANTQIAGVAPTLSAADAQIALANEQVAAGQTQVAEFAPTIVAANTRIAGVEPTLQSANEQIAVANTEVAGVEPTLNAANEQIALANTEVAAGQTQVAEFAPTIDSVNTEIAGVEPTLSAANFQIDIANTQVAGFAPTIAAANTQVAGVEPTLQSANAQIAVANTQVAGVEPTLNAANEQISAANLQIVAGQTQVAGFEPTVNAANEQIIAGQTQVAGFEPTINAANTEIAGVAPTLNAANTQIAGVVPTLEAVEGEIEAQRGIADALRLVRSADQLLQAGNPDLAIALVLQAYQLNPSLGEVQRILNDATPLTVRLSITGSSVAEFTPDGRWLIVGGSNGAEVWDLATRGLLHSLPTDAVSAMVLSPDGAQVVIGTRSGDIHVFDTGTGVEHWHLRQHRASITALDYNPQAPQIISGDSQGVAYVWDLVRGEIINSLPEPHPSAVVKVVFNENGSAAYSYNLLTHEGDRTLLPRIGVFNFGQAGAFRNGPPEYRGFSENGRIGYTGGDGRDFLKFFDADSTVEQRTFRLGNANEDYIDHITFSRDGLYILVEVESRIYTQETYRVRDRYIALWDIRTGGEIRRFNFAVEDPAAWDVNSLTFSADGQFALIGGRFNTINTVTLWDVNTGLELRRFSGHNATPGLVAFTENNTYGLSLSDDGNVRIWDIGEAELNIVNQTHISADTLDTFGISADGKLAYVAVNNRSFTTYDLTTNTEVHDVDFTTGAWTHVAFSPTEPQVLVVAVDRMALYSLTQPLERLHVFDDVNPGNVAAVTYSPDGQYLYYSISSSTFRWDVPSRSLYQELNAGGTLLAPNNNNEFIAIGRSNTIQIVDMVENRVVQTFEHTGGTINSLDYSPHDDTVLTAVGEPDNSVIVWDIRTGVPRYTLIGHTAPVTIALYSPDGLQALSGAADGSLILWDLTSGQAIREYKGHTAPIRYLQFNPEASAAHSISTIIDDGIITWRVESASDTVNWVYANRYIREINCQERLQYNIQPFCEDGVIPTAFPTPTSQASATPTPTSTPRPTVTPTPTPIPTGTIATSNNAAANIRSGAGPGFSLVTQANSGTVVLILERRDDIGWWYVRLPDGTEGWIARDVVRLN